jgi:hypothetical protein
MYGIVKNNQVIARFTAPLSVLSNEPSFYSDSLSLKRQTVKRGVQRWEIEAGLEPLVQGANDLFLISLTGHSTVVKVRVPQLYDISKQNLPASFNVVTGSQNSNTLNVTGMNSNIPVGTFIKFSNHSKIYTLISTGLNTCQVYPKLIQSVNNTFMYLDERVEGDFYLDPTVLKGFSYIDGVLMELGTVTLVEKL